MVHTDSKHNGTVTGSDHSVASGLKSIQARDDIEALSLANEATWLPTERVLDALKNLAQENFRHIEYDENELHRRLSGYCGLNEDYIQTYAGADVALEAICRTYLEPGVEILIASPTMSRITSHADSFGVRVMKVNNPSPFDVNVDRLIERVNDFTRLIYIGQPSLPGGAVLSDSEARYLLDNAGRAMVIVDESALMLRQYSLTHLVKRYRNLFVVRSFDGAYGLEAQPFGIVLSHPDNLKMLNRYRLGHSPHILANIAASAVLSDMDRIDERINNIHENMIYLTVRLRSKQTSCRITPSGHVLIKTENPAEVIERLRYNDIFALSLERYEHLENYILVPVRSGDFGPLLIDACENELEDSTKGGFKPNAKITLKTRGFETSRNKREE